MRSWLVCDKGINELVEAFEKLNIEHLDTRLILVGRMEPDLDPLKPETLAKMDCNKNIAAVGLQDDVRPWLAASDVFVFPSYREGFLNVVIEAVAMAHNCVPIVFDSSPVFTDIIDDGINGCIVPDLDEEAFFMACDNLMNDEELLAQMGQNAKEKVRKFSMDKVCAAWQTLFKEC